MFGYICCACDLTCFNCMYARFDDGIYIYIHVDVYWSFVRYVYNEELSLLEMIKFMRVISYTVTYTVCTLRWAWSTTDFKSNSQCTYQQELPGSRRCSHRRPRYVCNHLSRQCSYRLDQVLPPDHLAVR